MPNSTWTETGSSISLTPVTTTVAAGSSTENVNYLTNADKINLMAQYSAELAIKTQLDTTASGLGISSTTYDNAVAAISATLITAGAPANWATTWPDGTTSGPWGGIQTTLANDWTAVATARTSLQSAISATQAAQQAASAQAAAIAAGATAAANAQAAAISIAAPMVVSALPALPSSTYPSGKVVWNTADGNLYQSTGSAWSLLAVNAASLMANSITAGQIAAGAIGATELSAQSVTASKMTITDTTNICGNPSGATGTDNWPGTQMSSVYANGLYGTGAAEYLLLFAASASSENAYYGGLFAVQPGEAYYISVDCCPGGYYSGLGSAPAGGFQAGLYTCADMAGDSPGWYYTPAAPTTQAGWATISGQITIPAGASYAKITVAINGTSGSWAFRNLIVRKAASGELLVDGSITADKIATGTLTANMITTGTLDAALVDITNLDASNISTGTLSAAMVLFPDGSELTTASRVLTSSIGPPPAWVSTIAYLSGSIVVDGPDTYQANEAVPAGSGPGTTDPSGNPYWSLLSWNFTSAWSDIWGVSFTATAESGSDAFNFSATLSLSAYIAIGISVDGGAPVGVMNYGYTSAGTLGTSVSYFASITGLTAGSHTFQFQAQAADNASSASANIAECYFVAQRIY